MSLRYIYNVSNTLVGQGIYSLYVYLFNLYNFRTYGKDKFLFYNSLRTQNCQLIENETRDLPHNNSKKDHSIWQFVLENNGISCSVLQPTCITLILWVNHYSALYKLNLLRPTDFCSLQKHHYQTMKRLNMIIKGVK